MTTDPGDLASVLLRAIRAGDDEAAAVAQRAIATLSDADLAAGLPDDDARVAFWINVYNAAVQQAPHDATATSRGRLRLFRRADIRVAGRDVSLDAIEHGILRRSRWKLSLGYLGNPVPSRFERTHRVRRLDPRVHFALNCGARSCPPIAAYDAEHIDAQLDRATRGSLSSDIARDRQTLRVPTVLLWFIGDFGGPPGVRRFLASHGVAGAGRPIRFLRYDWTPARDRWLEDE